MGCDRFMSLSLGLMGKGEKFAWGLIDMCLLSWGLQEWVKNLHKGVSDMCLLF